MTDDLRNSREATDTGIVECHGPNGLVWRDIKRPLQDERAIADAEIERLNLLLRFREEQNIQISKGTESLMREIAEGKKREERLREALEELRHFHGHDEWNHISESFFDSALSGGTDEAK